MSLDSLFQQILLTEQQLTEQTQRFKEVKVAIIRCNEKIQGTTEKYEKTIEELDEKAQQSSVMRLQRDLMKKREEQMLKQIEELLCQRSRLRERLAKIKKESKEEEERFLQEISRFNSDFSLRGNRDAVFQSQTHTEILDLQRDVESLYKEMELMSRGNSHMIRLQEEQLELQDLDDNRRDVDRQLSAAEATTESLRAESLLVGQKPLADSTCLRSGRSIKPERRRFCARRSAQNATSCSRSWTAAEEVSSVRFGDDAGRFHSTVKKQTRSKNEERKE
ncbi:putative coiled-coil domain-containing protein 172 isoform 2 [Scophthalmus maximus]|uniref:Coiled-coil domain-containing protein 172 n=1 Tax=Scophthalmus maximus TaxID=52904 RepID=A0A2U9CG37_SCOMX|nr:coiled-coil domain-containing protein 172 isoform X1 [Scophthalmus maximus]AWP14676.1 putative coiled-coil domain-containing protein 172 isoform 2 [Scophthalmus maximus]